VAALRRNLQLQTSRRRSGSFLDDARFGFSGTAGAAETGSDGDVPARLFLSAATRSITLLSLIGGLSVSVIKPPPWSQDPVSAGFCQVSGRLPSSGPAVTEVAALLAELRELGWIPASARNDV
jgi:hypothetical protein